jgi:tRNA threonylcarbamoyladenosine biosynthesis protein TsaB
MDTCDARGSVALLDGETVLATAIHDSAEDYSTWLLPAVERVLETAGRKLPDVGVYAAAAGPGSFTGIRIALTTVKAWSEALHKPIAAVSRLEALAVAAAVKGPAASPFLAACCDAQRGQLYAAVYRRRGQSLQRLGEETVVSPGELIRWAASQAGAAAVAWVTLDREPLAAEPAWRERAANGETVEQVPAVLAPAIGKIALQLAARNALTDALLLDANYIRRPDAEVKWKGYSRPAVTPQERKIVAHRVRAFQPTDAGGIAQLAAASPQAARWSESSYATLLDSGYRAWVVAGSCHDRGTVAGFLIARTVLSEAEILNLAVAPENRRTGVASALLETALGEWTAGKLQRVHLEVRASNAAAISFYKNHLFRVTGARPGYYQQPAEDAVLMERLL